MKRKPEHDHTLHPHKHAYSGETRKGRKGEKDVELCWYCGEAEHKHKQRVQVKKGERLVVPVE